MTAPNSTDDIDRILDSITLGLVFHINGVDKSPTYEKIMDERKTIAKAAIQAEVQRQFLLGKLEAYKNVVSWEESYGGSPVLSALEAHKTAVRDIEQQLEALQQGDK